MTYYSGTDLANAFRTVRKNTLQVAHDLPANKFDFRATPDTRSVAETLAHIAANTRWVHRAHGVDKVTSISHEGFMAYIGDANAYAATLTDATLAERVAFTPPSQASDKTRFEMLLGVKEHEMHHRAQLMLIERMVGVVPHLTRARQAR
jgi:uncharacterized damage-inducible protein DinB